MVAAFYSHQMAVGERVITRAPGTRETADANAARSARIRVAIAGATGYAGGELVRILARHPHVELVGLTGRERDDDPIESIHPHLRATDLAIGSDLPDADAVFLAMPHGAAAERVSSIVETGATVVDLGPDFRLHDPASYPRWYGFEHPARAVLADAIYGLPELHRDELVALAGRSTRVVASPGCYPTASLLALAPLARAGLVADVVIDAKSGVSGAGRELKAEMMFSEANESVRAYGVGGHRHQPEIEQEIGALRGEATAVTFVPHLVPMTRGILATAYVTTPRPVAQAEIDEIYAHAYANEPFVTVVDAPPGTKHVLGSNHCHVFARADEPARRVIAIAVIDNLVKGAAGQAVQAFNLVHDLPETAGLEQLPLAP